MVKRLLVAALLTMLTVTVSMGSTLTTTPVRMAFDGSGNILVTDYTYGQVLTVTPDKLAVIHEININGRPLGVAWANGLIYVGNNTTKRVEVFNEYGQNIFDLGHGQHPDICPQDIVITDYVYVVDSNDNTIKVFDLDGTFVTTLGDKILTNPTAITVDDFDELIFISDYGDLGKNINPSIKVLDKQGNLVYSIKAGKPNKFRFSMPQGLVVQNYKLYMVDALSSEVHIFSTIDGRLLSKVKGSGIDMRLPLDLLIKGDTLYVTNSLDGSIKIFKLKN